MSEGVADRRPRVAAPLRPWCVVAAGLVLVGALAPPLGTLARRTEYAASLQFSLLAIVVPALVTVGGPWRRLGLVGRSTGAPRVLDRLADRRRRHRELPWSLGFVGADLTLAVCWHTPAAVEAVSRHWWLAIVEAVTLLAAGIGLWLELVTSPPLEPRSGHLRRAVLAAMAMWVFWILAYVTLDQRLLHQLPSCGRWLERHGGRADRSRRALVRGRFDVRAGDLLERAGLVAIRR
jgi:hypothetical protein